MGPAPKNLLILMSDEHDPRFLGVSGHPRVKTPHLDALAARGRRFDAAYTPSPICVPARAAFATGRRVHEIRHWDNAMPYDGRHPGWGHALQAAGVPVESIGKLHYRAEEDPAGFDVEHIPMHVVGGHGMVWASIRDPYVQPGEKARGRMLGPYIGPGESTYTEYDRSVTARAVEWFGAAPEGPWVLYVGLVAPHFPLVCPPEFFDLYPPAEMPEPKLAPGSGYTPHPWVAEQGAFMDNEAHFRDAAERKAAISAYHGLVSWLDHNVGEILGALEGAGLGGATRVVYTSDHGDNVGARGLWGKSNMYEESVRVPLILAGPDVAPGVETAPVDLLDLAPTILEGAGASVPEGLPGRTLFGALDPERPIFSEYHAAGSNTAAFMLRRGRWKLIHYVGHAPELFDLAEDPEELTDLAAARPEIVAALEAELRSICDPVETDRAAKADQAALINRFGGRAAAIALGADGATPPPKG
ncbi:MAG: sulfatase-like hydrolase/transferase [Pseudomonadota bacterium]